MEQPVQSQRITLRRTEIQATFRSHVGMHSNVPHVAFPGLLHVWIATTLVVRNVADDNSFGHLRTPRANGKPILKVLAQH
jgi:hypothetical protein